jgi:hypothetical protein
LAPLASAGGACCCHRIALVIGVAWLIGLPFIPLTAEKALVKALMQDATGIQIGMTEAQVQATMADYR